MTSFKRPQSCIQCSSPITEFDRYVAMGGSGFHWPCYDQWPHKEAKGRKHVEQVVDHEKTSGYTAKVHLDERVYVEVQEGMPDDWVKVYPFKTGIAKWVRLKDWPVWLNTIESSSEESHPIERSALLEILPNLRSAIPDVASIVNRINFRAKEQFRVGRTSPPSSPGQHGAGNRSQ